MTPEVVLRDLKAHCQRVLQDLRPFGFSSEEEKERVISYYLYSLPEPEHTPMSAEAGTTMVGDEAEHQYKPQDFEGMMPALVLAPIKYEPPVGDLLGRLAVSLEVGVYSDDPKNQDGPRAVINILTRLVGKFSENLAISDRCQLDAVPDWEISDNTSRPLWWGNMMLSVCLPASQQLTNSIGNHDWRGDFVGRKEK